MTALKNFVKTSYFWETYKSRYLVWQLTKRDFKSRFAGSALGLVWAFLQPVSMMVILWFVFTFGLKAQRTTSSIPFAPWFFSAMVSWNFFQDALFSTTNSLSEYAFLVKKVNFQIRLIPLIKIFSGLILHIIFIAILLVILLISHIEPSFYWLQAFYFLFCTGFLLLGIGLITSAFNVFSRDTGQLVGIATQFGFWLTPIIWDIQTLPLHYQYLLKLNPVYYITEGYRWSFVYHRSFWEAGFHQTIYFWSVSGMIYFVGKRTFSRLRPHFGDVL